MKQSKQTGHIANVTGQPLQQVIAKENAEVFWRMQTYIFAEPLHNALCAVWHICRFALLDGTATRATPEAPVSVSVFGTRLAPLVAFVHPQVLYHKSGTMLRQPAAPFVQECRKAIREY